MSRKAKAPSLRRDLLMLGDLYLTLGWLAVQRLRFGPLWPWEARPRKRGSAASRGVVAPLRSHRR